MHILNQIGHNPVQRNDVTFIARNVRTKLPFFESHLSQGSKFVLSCHVGSDVVVNGAKYINIRIHTYARNFVYPIPH